MVISTEKEGEVRKFSEMYVGTQVVTPSFNIPWIMIGNKSRKIPLVRINPKNGDYSYTEKSEIFLPTMSVCLHTAEKPTFQTSATIKRSMEATVNTDFHPDR